MSCSHEEHEEHNKNWIKRTKNILKVLNDLKAKDRLEYVDAILRCVLTIQSSNKGWMMWLSSPGVMKNFSKEELHEILESFKIYAVRYLKLDLKWTKEIEKKVAEKKKKMKKDLIHIQKEKSKSYIS